MVNGFCAERSEVTDELTAGSPSTHTGKLRVQPKPTADSTAESASQQATPVAGKYGDLKPKKQPPRPRSVFPSGGFSSFVSGWRNPA